MFLVYAKTICESCASINPTESIREVWSNVARRSIQCNANGFMDEKSFVSYFNTIINSKADERNQAPKISFESIKKDLNDWENTWIDYSTIIKTDFYKFLQNPYYSILKNKFDMSPSNEALFKNESFLKPENEPLMVGWAERNFKTLISIDKNNNIDVNTVKPADITDEVINIDGFQYLVGDPNCKVPFKDKSNQFKLSQGCSICDQYGVGTDKYYLCAIGYNWRLPLTWNEGDQDKDKQRNCPGSDLVTLINTLKSQFHFKDGHNCRLWSKGCNGDYSDDPNGIKEIYRLLIAAVSNNRIDSTIAEINFAEFKKPMDTPNIADYLRELLRICFNTSINYSYNGADIIRYEDAQKNSDAWLCDDQIAGHNTLGRCAIICGQPLTPARYCNVPTTNNLRYRHRIMY